jgi:aminoglycoside phosphotransferase (APT) family kinase protein
MVVSASATTPGLEGALRGVCAAAFGDGGVRIEALRRLSGGASRQTWSFDVIGNDGARTACILRRDPPGAPRRAVGMTEEASLLASARGAGVPVPEVLISGDGGGSLGTPFMVMRRVEGETIPRRILREPALAQARQRLTGQCADALACIHAIPLGVLPKLSHSHPLVEYRSLLDAHKQAHPAFELGFRWLEENRPPPSRITLVHGDFRNGNLIVGPDGLRAVLDWELAHIGDPLEDLGWLCVKSWRFGSPHRVGGFGDVDQLLDAYAQASGRRIDPQALRWWEVMGTLRWGIICILQAANHLSGAVRSVELAAIGRRVCEVENDLLLLLDG